MKFVTTRYPLSLLVHDLNVCSSSYEWNKVIKTLSKTNTVYTIDLLGCGCSDRPALTYTNFLYVQLVTDFIKHNIGKKTDVIVSGDASPFILMACANDDSIINRVIMINPPNLVNLAKIPTKRSKMLKNILFTPIIGTFIYNMEVNKRTIVKKFTKSYLYDQNEMREKDIDRKTAELLHYNLGRTPFYSTAEKDYYLTELTAAVYLPWNRVFEIGLDVNAACGMQNKQ